jgi:uncharacterized membrane protein
VERVVGVDMARGLAVLGMFAAHVGSDRPEFWTSTGWLQVADGRSAATFALLAGVSAALLSGGPVPAVGAALTRARTRIVVRAALLWPLGFLMIALGTLAAVILPGYAVMFGLTAMTLTWRRRTLLVTSAVVAVVGPVVLHALRSAELTRVSGHRLPQILDVLVGPYYPAIVWMAYLLVGVALGRTDLQAPGTPVRLAALGGGLAVLGYGSAAIAARTVTSATGRELLTAAPHSGTTPELVGNIGVSLAVVGVCVALSRVAPRLVVPLAATGALALTAYCGQLVAIAMLGNDIIRDPDNVRLVIFVVVTMAAATLWRLTIGRGPLESLLNGFSTAVADAVAPRRAPDRPTSAPPEVRPEPAADRAGS